MSNAYEDVLRPNSEAAEETDPNHSDNDSDEGICNPQKVGVPEASISAKCCTVLASARTSWKDCAVKKLVVCGAELDIFRAAEVATVKALLYFCRQDACDGLEVMRSGAVSRTLTWRIIVNPLER